MKQSDDKDKKILYLVILVFVLALCVLSVFLIKKIMQNTNNNPTEEPKQEKTVFSYTPIMYKICDDDNCNYLLGSMHIGDKRINKYNQVVIDAYNEMDEFASEVDMKEMANVNVFDYLQGDSFDMVADEELKEKVSTFFKEHKRSYDVLKEYSIGYIYLMITNQIYIDAGFTVTGADSYFGTKAINENRPTNAFETVEFQMNLLTNYTEEFYIEALNEILDSYEENIQIIKDMYKYYLEADIENLYNSIQSDASTELEEEFNKELIDNRNISMTEKIEEFLEQDKNVFIVVGAAHVIGEGGIIDLLSNKNYEISLVK